MSKLHNISVYEEKISNIVHLLSQKFSGDILLYFNHNIKKFYDYKKTKKYIADISLPKSLKKISEKNYYEFRFFCETKKILTTKSKSQFFSLFKVNSKLPQFFMIPYFDIVAEKSEEFFVKIDFSVEIILKIYSNKIEWKINCKEKNKKIDSLYSDIKKCFFSTRRLQPIDLSRNFFKTPRLPEKKIKKSINSMKIHMNQGDCYLANITNTTMLSKNKFVTMEHFLKSWFRLQPQYGIYFEKKYFGLACFSPERFLLCRNNHILSEPIKGTLPLAGSKGQKKEARKLWSNEKEMYEHTLVVDLIRNDLNSFCKPGSVKVAKPFQARIAGKLYQMQSSVFGKKESKQNPGDCFLSMLPAGSITGTPKQKVCQLISQYEIQPRGYYTGVSGILEPNGNFDSCVLIRSVYKGERGVYFGVGAGLTTLSNTNEEWKEFKVKLESFLNGFTK